MIPDHTLPLDELPCGCVNSHFLDSGAFTQWTIAEKYWQEDKENRSRWSYYHTAGFIQYLDGYAAFIKEHRKAIDLYANLDVIGNPKLTWRNQKWLEVKHNLHPVPVVHYGTDLKWLQWYVDHNYDIIGLGGLVGSTAEDGCRRWIDQAFQMVCPPPKRLPKVKLHGFGVTTYELLIRYPWYSVDSTSWTKVGAFGGILVPHKRWDGKRWVWDFSKQPYLMKVADDRVKEDVSDKIKSGRGARTFFKKSKRPKNPDRMKAGKHILTIPKAEREIIEGWLKYIGVPIGKMDEDGTAIEHGVTTHHTYRKAANLLFFEELRKWLPDYPFPFRTTRRSGFGLI